MFLLFISLSPFKLVANTLDYDIEKYSITLNITNLSGNAISGHTVIKFKSENSNLTEVNLMLESLTVDSVLDLSNNSKLSYYHSGIDLKISLETAMSLFDTAEIDIYYHGQPASESWGGFFFSSQDGGYAFNMGVAFSKYPHSYGRAWFPCKESFSDKATFSYFIRVDSIYTAVCGGILRNIQINPDGTKTYHWEMRQPIPPYLASVAVGKYTDVTFVYHGIEKNYPVSIYCLPTDTNKVKSSFINLPNALNFFEQMFGPFPFDRVGFVIVPFSSGAMEHASNIAYPRSAVDGTLNNESLWVHELSHNWWGNSVTCLTDADMWINEGTASYSEFLFNERMYGKENYNQLIKSNHKFVLQYVHIIDGQALSLSPMPAETTYGRHSYDKGADIMHNLRTYLGDSLFFISVQKYFSANKFKNTDAIGFRDSFSRYSGFNLSYFFDDWIFEKGFPFFFIDSTFISKKGNDFEIFVLISNSPRFNNHDYNQVPLLLSFYDKNRNVTLKKVQISGKSQAYNIKLDFSPELLAVNLLSEVGDASTREIKVLGNIGTYDFKMEACSLNVKNISDSALFLIEHHWNGPDHSNTQLKGIRFSDYRYWTMNGILGADFTADLHLYYNGRTGSYDGNTYLDHILNIVNEDSIVCLYRKNPQYPWIICPEYVLNTGSKTNKIGEIIIKNVQKGDYCIGIMDFSAGYGLKRNEKKNLIYPNPTSGIFNINLLDNTAYRSYTIYELNGGKVFSGKINANEINILDGSALPQGQYLIKLTGNGVSHSENIIISH